MRNSACSAQFRGFSSRFPAPCAGAEWRRASDARPQSFPREDARRRSKHRRRSRCRPATQQTVAWSDDAIAAAKRDCAKLLLQGDARIRAASAAEGRRFAARRRRSSSSRSAAIQIAIDPPATMTCALATRAQHLDQARRSSRTAKAILGTQRRSSCITPLPIPAATGMAERPRRSASMRSPTRSTFPSSCSSPGSKVTVLASWPRVVTRAARAAAQSHTRLRRDDGIDHPGSAATVPARRPQSK